MKLIFALILLLVVGMSLSAQTTIISNSHAQIGQFSNIIISSSWTNSPAYLCALSWGHSPGQKILNAWIPLNFDNLFVVSVQMANIYPFVYTHGILRKDGGALARVNIPNCIYLRGLRYSVAAIIYGGWRIMDVSNPWETQIL